MGYGYGPWAPGFWQIIIIVMVFFWIFKPRYGRRFDRRMEEFQDRFSQQREAYEEALDVAEEKIEQLEDRICVLEKIVTDTHKKHTLAEEIESLRQ